MLCSRWLIIFLIVFSFVAVSNTRKARKCAKSVMRKNALCAKDALSRRRIKFDAGEQSNSIMLMNGDCCLAVKRRNTRLFSLPHGMHKLTFALNVDQVKKCAYSCT
ncbi:unnamed protein product [Cylicocyclus nassatus]|uniref:Secreted protein n=1 Tax=Cylicocyclus nassatus TaxID=53992 RepID=A0AA36M5E3_CYLNA|nr:unnamed protein product [Cylicocyclus nassatus]